MIEALGPLAALVIVNPFDLTLSKIENSDPLPLAAEKHAAIEGSVMRLRRFYESLDFRRLLGKHMTYSTELCIQLGLLSASSVRRSPKQLVPN